MSMSTDSTADGFLASSAGGPAPLEDQALNRFLQQMVSQITGVPGSLVRPRWQPEPPNQPEIDVTWVAIGVADMRGDTFAAELHASDGASSTIYRQEDIDVLMSFYGPSAGTAFSALREGLSLEQNRSYLTAAGFGLIGMPDGRAAPALLNDRWQYRIDATLQLRRGVARKYPILNVLSLDETIKT